MSVLLPKQAIKRKLPAKLRPWGDETFDENSFIYTEKISDDKKTSKTSESTMVTLKKLGPPGY